MQTKIDLEANIGLKTTPRVRRIIALKLEKKAG